MTAVKESAPAPGDQFPIWVRHGIVHSGSIIPHPERHPCCEFSAFLEGAATAFVGPERIELQAGEYFLAGPGVARWYEGTQYPVRHAAIYFHPSIAIEMGPVGDGLAILLRFGARQSLADHLFRPPPALKSRFRDGFDEMIREFEQKEFGHEVRLRNIFMELLIQMLRWERKAGRGDEMTWAGPRRDGDAAVSSRLSQAGAGRVQ